MLNPEQGETILDMCAAPGGKTTQIADRINNKGSVQANDSSSNRLQTLQANTFRMGGTCVKTTNHDGRELPEDQKYDRILVDAPCTGEGDRFRKGKGAAPMQESIDMSVLQKQLLEAAVDHLKPGGSVVYSTCTINPVENEEVVDEVLQNHENLEMKAETPLEESQEGIIRFKGREYSNELKKSVRILPHHLNSGVIFCAKMVKQK